MAFFFENESDPVTALFDEEGEQLFETLGILSMATSPSNTFAEHTLEDGQVAIENKIENRVPIVVSAILSPDDFKEVYARIKEADKNNTKFTIQNRVDTFENMYIESYPYEESSRIVNTIAISINFIEQQIVGSRSEGLAAENVNNPADADAIDSGAKVPAETPTTLTNVLTSVGIL